MLIKLINWNLWLYKNSLQTKQNIIYFPCHIAIRWDLLWLTFDNLKEAIQKLFICLHLKWILRLSATSFNAAFVIILCNFRSNKEGTYVFALRMGWWGVTSKQHLTNEKVIGDTLPYLWKDFLVPTNLFLNKRFLRNIIEHISFLW